MAREGTGKDWHEHYSDPQRLFFFLRAELTSEGPDPR